MQRPLLDRSGSDMSVYDQYNLENGTREAFPPRGSSANGPQHSPRSLDDHEGPFRMGHASLTPSMSASNLGHHGVGEDDSGARAWLHHQAGHEKLQSSKEKYDFIASEYQNNGPEDDDDFHDPGHSIRGKGPDRRLIDSRKIRAGSSCSFLGILNILAIVIISAALIGVFAGLPISEYFTRAKVGTGGSFGMFGTNSSGQVPRMPRDLVDVDTPQSVKSRKGQDGSDYVLVFSDEFNEDGRTFWPGDDPYWEAVDLHYYGTDDLERYIPDQVTTKDGAMVITLADAPDPVANGNLDYISSMVQSWNKFCFTGGILEVNVSFPGDGIVPGFWPAAWTMGNMGRAGHGATTDGTWPYSYEACDVGTLPNQTNYGDDTTPAAAKGGELSYLPGQKLSSCTCPGEDHPGPVMSDGTYRGRAAPEMDLIEAQTNRGVGTVVSQSYQLAPFNADYRLLNGTNGREYFTDSGFDTIENSYHGGVYQQAASGLSEVPTNAFEASDGWLTYGLEYTPTKDGGNSIYWLQDGKPTWQLTSTDLGPDSKTEISSRPISNEPMCPCFNVQFVDFSHLAADIILNLGISNSFGEVDTKHLPIPAEYRIDYVRLWQKTGHADLGCDGVTGSMPTTNYINKHLEAYTNPNLTLWSDYGATFPKNRLQHGNTC